MTLDTVANVAAFLAEFGILVRRVRANPNALRAKRPDGRQLWLQFAPGANLRDIRVTVRAGPWDARAPGEWLEEVWGRHTVCGEPCEIGGLGHTCLNAINANSYPRVAE
jgi:hypothetical protein